MLRARLQQNIAVQYCTIDSRFAGSDSVNLKNAQAELCQELIPSFAEYKDDRVKRLCDYTGVEMSWTPGPRSISLEAIYPYVSNGHGLAYRAHPNVCLAMTSLNLARRRSYPSIVLPLVAVWLNTHSEPDFELRKTRWAWTFNALSNAAIMHQAFHGSLPHLPRHEKQMAWETA